jgi:hypothetical protein
VSDESLSQTERNLFDATAQHDIGLKVLTADSPLWGTWLNPEASIFTCQQGSHFITVTGSNKDSKLTVWDTLNPEVVTATRDELDFAPDYILRLY